MLWRPKYSTIEAVAPKEEEEFPNCSLWNRMQKAILNDVMLTADCTVIWGNLTTWARPRCRTVSWRAAKLICDRGIFGTVDHTEGPHYCSRRTVLVCAKEHGWKWKITTPINWQLIFVDMNETTVKIAVFSGMVQLEYCWM